MSAIYWTSDNGHYKVVRVLLAAKATVNTQNKVCFNFTNPFLLTYSFYFVQFGQFPLWVASLQGHQKCVELLINAQANVDMQNEVSIHMYRFYTMK